MTPSKTGCCSTTNCGPNPTPDSKMAPRVHRIFHNRPATSSPHLAVLGERLHVPYRSPSTPRFAAGQRGPGRPNPATGCSELSPLPGDPSGAPHAGVPSFSRRASVSAFPRARVGCVMSPLTTASTDILNAGTFRPSSRPKSMISSEHESLARHRDHATSATFKQNVEHGPYMTGTANLSVKHFSN